MKKNRFYYFLFALTMLSYFGHAQTGTVCSNPFLVTGSDCSIQTNQSNSELWFKFAANVNNQNISFASENLSGKYDTIKVYTGTCSSLTLILSDVLSSTANGTGEELTGITAAQTYYVRLSRDPSITSLNNVQVCQEEQLTLCKTTVTISTPVNSITVYNCSGGGTVLPVCRSDSDTICIHPFFQYYGGVSGTFDHWILNIYHLGFPAPVIYSYNILPNGTVCLPYIQFACDSAYTIKAIPINTVGDTMCFYNKTCPGWQMYCVPDPYITFSPKDTVCTDSTICFTGNDSTNPFTQIYFWDFGDGGSASGSPACYNYTNDTTYTVVVTEQGTYPCPNAKDSIQVTILPCCTVAGLNLYLTDTNINSVTYIGFTIQVNDSLNIIGNCNFNKCKIYMGPNAKINLAPNSNVTFKSCHILSACDYMWDFIEVPQGDTVNFQRGCLVEDARCAIFSRSGGIVRTTATTFNRCFTGIGFGPTNLLTDSTRIVNTNFTTRDFSAFPLYNGTNVTLYLNALLNAYTVNPYAFPVANMKAPRSGSRSYLGVHIQGNTNNFPLRVGRSNDGKNWFDHLKYGIYSEQSNIRVQENKFFGINNNSGTFCTNAVDPTPCIECQIGTGICIAGTKGKTVKAEIGGYYSLSSNKFDTLLQGIQVVNPENVVIVGNKLSEVTYGISTIGDRSRNIEIAQNALKYSFIGISCKDNVNSFIRIDSNLINPTGVAIPVNPFFPVTGIYISDVVASGAQLYIRSNGIKATNVGVNITGVGYTVADVSDQNLIQWQGVASNFPSPNKYHGVAVINSKGVRVDNNTIRTTVLPVASLASIGSRLRGVSVENSPNTTVSHNDISRMGNGVYCYGFNTASRLGCNIVFKNYSDFNFTGAFISTGNPLNFSSDVGDQLFNGATPSPTGNTFTNYGGSATDLTGNIKPQISWYYPTGGYQPSSSGLNLGSLNGGLNQPQPSSNPDACTFLPFARTSQQERQAVAGDPLNNLPQFSSANEEVYQRKKHIHRALKDHQNWLNLSTPDDAMYQAFYNDAQARNIGKFAEVDNEIAAGNISLAFTKNNSIADSGLIEQNTKTVNEIYLNSFASDRYLLTQVEYNALWNIAWQVPLTGGIEPVYRARVMLDIYIDDSDITGISHKMASNEEEVTELDREILIAVYPNPANEVLFIEKLEKTEGNFEIVDVVGKVISVVSLKGGTNKYSFDASQLSLGIYFYRYTVNGESKQTGKITITH